MTELLAQVNAEFARMFAKTPAPDKPVPMDQERDDERTDD